MVQQYLQQRAALIDLKKSTTIRHGNPINSSDTVYLATADKDGNSCSFIASNYAGERSSFFTPITSYVWYPQHPSSQSPDRSLHATHHSSPPLSSPSSSPDPSCPAAAV
jgi:gamma-glutamyltranspeptidase